MHYVKNYIIHQNFVNLILTRLLLLFCYSYNLLNWFLLTKKMYNIIHNYNVTIGTQLNVNYT